MAKLIDLEFIKRVNAEIDAMISFRDTLIRWEGETGEKFQDVMGQFSEVVRARVGKTGVTVWVDVPISELRSVSDRICLALGAELADCPVNAPCTTVWEGLDIKIIAITCNVSQ